ncbi:hypothetical protein [Vibrio cholerae]|uniref:hypothetical protein n=1 Tax=Vibrio cholerae TaxID=666 RepID=UPI000E6C305E|nr:hypothetical protein [Vibrio cholerae]
MQSSEIRNHTEPSRKAELFDALSIMLQEAGSRGNTHEAAYVISGVLENLSRDYPEIKVLAHNWTELANLESKMKGAA